MRDVREPSVLSLFLEASQYFRIKLKQKQKQKQLPLRMVMKQKKIDTYQKTAKWPLLQRAVILYKIPVSVTDVGSYSVGCRELMGWDWEVSLVGGKVPQRYWTLRWRMHLEGANKVAQEQGHEKLNKGIRKALLFSVTRYSKCDEINKMSILIKGKNGVLINPRCSNLFLLQKCFFKKSEFYLLLFVQLLSNGISHVFDLLL